MSSSSARRRVLFADAARAPADKWRPNDLAFLPPGGGPVLPDPIADAYALGFEEGRREGEVAEQARLHGARQAAEDALDVIRANEERWSESIDENIIALAITVARHVVDRELLADPDIVSKTVGRALAAFPIDQPVRIRVNPSDLRTLDERGMPSLDDLAGEPQRAAHWIPDPRIAPGGCVVEGRDRIVDGRVDTALERVYRRLTNQHD